MSDTFTELPRLKNGSAEAQNSMRYYPLTCSEIIAFEAAYNICFYEGQDCIPPSRKAVLKPFVEAYLPHYEITTKETEMADEVYEIEKMKSALLE